MKKYLYLIPLIIAATVSCSKETPAGDTNGAGQPEDKVTYVEGGITIVAEAEMTKVTVTPVGEEGAYTDSQMAWEAGDEIKVYHDGNTYTFVATTAGTSTTFKSKTVNDVINSLNLSKPVVAYYNVSSVAADGKATFSIPASQTEGTASNKVPLYAYTATPSLDEDRLSLTFSSLASVLEFKVSAGISTSDPFTYHLTKVVLTPKTGATGWTAMTSGTVDPSTGEITSDSQSLSALTYNFAASTDIVGGKHFQLVAGACRMNNTGATMDWYKGEIQNYTKDIWASKDINLVAERAHKYQPIAEKVVGIANYSDYYSKFYANRNAQDKFIESCDDERTMILTGDINMLAGTDPSLFRNVSFPGLEWNFDGKNHRIYNFLCTDAKRLTCLFSNVQADIRNVQFGATGSSARNSVTISDDGKGGSYGIISDVISGTIENVTSYLNWTITINSTNKSTYVGGIVANMKGGNIRNCYNRGSVTLVTGDGVSTSGNLIAGGIVGNSSGIYTVENSQNYATVSVRTNSSGPIFSAGIVGAISLGCTITGCENHEAVTAENTNETDQSEVPNAQVRAAGILARVPSNSSGTESTAGRIINSTNYGQVSGAIAAAVKNFQVAGIIADFQANNISSGCVSRGDIFATKAGAEDNSAIGWFSVWAGSNPTSASVLKGIQFNSKTISESNYNLRNYWSRNAAPDEGVLVLLSDSLASAVSEGFSGTASFTY